MAKELHVEIHAALSKLGAVFVNKILAPTHRSPYSSSTTIKYY